MKTLVQAVAEYRGEIERKEREKIAEEQRASQVRKAIERDAIASFVQELQGVCDFNLAELNWVADFQDWKGNAETRVFEIMFTVHNGHGEAQLHNRAELNLSTLKWTFPDPRTGHNVNEWKPAPISELTWRIEQNGTYDFAYSTIEAIAKMAPQSWTEANPFELSKFADDDANSAPPPAND